MAPVVGSGHRGGGVKLAMDSTIIHPRPGQKLSTSSPPPRGFGHIRGELAALIANTSLAVKGLCIAVFISYLLTFYEPAIEFLSITPGHLLPPSFWVWTIFTHPFLELHLWEVLIDILTVGLCGKLIEPLWGTREVVLFFILVNLSVAVLSVSYYLFMYAVTFDTTVLFNVKIHGLSGFVAAMSVAVRQIMPDSVLLRTPLGKLTNRNIPLTVLVISILLWAIGLQEGSYCTMFASGAVTSWIYLRFYQRHLNGTRGDFADNFNFASFFPNVLQPAISIVSNSVFQFFVTAGICRKPVKRFTDSSGPSSIHINMNHRNESSDADRRRQKALKLLNERLGGRSKDESKRPLLSDDSEDNFSSSNSRTDIHRTTETTNFSQPSQGNSSVTGDVIIPVFDSQVS